MGKLVGAFKLNTFLRKFNKIIFNKHVNNSNIVKLFLLNLTKQ